MFIDTNLLKKFNIYFQYFYSYNFLYMLEIRAERSKNELEEKINKL